VGRGKEKLKKTKQKMAANTMMVCTIGYKDTATPCILQLRKGMKKEVKNKK